MGARKFNLLMACFLNRESLHHFDSAIKSEFKVSLTTLIRTLFYLMFETVKQNALNLSVLAFLLDQYIVAVITKVIQRK